MHPTDQQLFAAARLARLATIGPDGPLLVPVVFAVADGIFYTAIDGKPKTTTNLKRLRNIADQPRVSLLVDHYDDENWSTLWWVRVDGEATVWPADSIKGQSGIDALVDKYPQYQQERPGGPAIAILPIRWQSWHGGGQ